MRFYEDNSSNGGTDIDLDFSFFCSSLVMNEKNLQASMYIYAFCNAVKAEYLWLT